MLSHRGIVPGRLRILPEIQHVVVMGMPAHAHADELDERRALSRSCALDGPCERRRNHVGIGAVDRDTGHAVAGRLVGEHPHCRLIAQGCRERGLIVLNAKDRGQPSRGRQVDRLVPLAQRRSSLADERQGDAAVTLLRKRHREARDRQRADRQRRGGRQDPPVEIAEVQIPAVHRRTRLPRLRRQREPHGRGIRPHRQHDAKIANQRRDDVTAPSAIGAKLAATP